MLTIKCVNHVNPLFLIESSPDDTSLKYLNKSKKEADPDL
ncbi:hypothetical protein HDF22_005159 [Mucilaginibacter lappiensis]|uniref:Uncharacterized protein n=1 Tax=Mucilaginibacter lappiensis TaxID=354630 RepID=A0A841JQH7_9SPHI|nr:hypothetical protein [Mucilaginibacter lappiensis]